MPPTPPPAKPLDLAGRIFFSSLCAGTLGLGIWQTQRYYETSTALQERTEQLRQPPLSSIPPTTSHNHPSFQRYTVRGVWQHEREFYVGPRGAPVDVPPGGSAPQGYQVWTPLVVPHNNNNNNDAVVLVNRGWIPRQALDGQDRGLYRTRQQPHRTLPPTWHRPTGPVDVTLVAAATETPRFLVPEHRDMVTQRKLVWMDRPAMMALGGIEAAPIQKDTTTDTTTDITTARETAPMLLWTQVNDDNDDNNNPHPQPQNNNNNDYPQRPTLTYIGQHRLNPEMHVGYAITWYGLAVAGMYMTRHMILKGRGG